jgi:hypothetical protein
MMMSATSAVAAACRALRGTGGEAQGFKMPIE